MEDLYKQNELCDYYKKLYADILIEIIQSKKFKELYFCYKNTQKAVNEKNCSMFDKIFDVSNKKTNKKKYNKLYSKLICYIDEKLFIDSKDEIEPLICINYELRTKYFYLLKCLISNKKFYKIYIKHSKHCGSKETTKLINFINGKIKCIKIICEKCTKHYLPKTIALLELTDNYFPNDRSVNKTLKYYWNNYPNEFKSFPIVDTKGNIDLTIQLLEYFYNKGYRYFYGCSRSTTLLGVLDWFNMHPDAIGISSISNAPRLKVPKNIFRLTPSLDNEINVIKNKLYSANTVYYIYTKDEVAMEDVKILLENDPNINNLQTYGLTKDNTTVSNLQNFLQKSTTNDLVCLLIINRNDYLNLYSNGLTCPTDQYDLSNTPPQEIIGEAANQLKNKYYPITLQNIGSSILWRDGYNSLGIENYSSTTLNTLNMLNTLVLKRNIDNINSHSGILQFDEVTRDIIYYSYLVKLFNGNSYNNQYLFVDDPYLGKYQATFENNTPIEIPTIINNLPIGKAIGLLELTNSPSDIDQVLYNSIYYYWYNDLDLPKFPIVNTEASITKTIQLLDKYYTNGYRLFLGFSRSTVVFGVLEWFKNHPDATGISVVSRASNLSVEKNIYRLDYPQNLVIETLIPTFEKAPTLYYIYTEDELVSLDYLEILSNNPNINLKTLAIKRDSSNLTVDVLTTFLEGSTSDDIILIVLFFNQQQYFDLYNQGLFFSGNQYYIIGALPSITGTAQDILNNKVINIQSVFSNTSMLWRKNTDYLTIKYKKIQSSYGLINGLKMIQFILENKSISLLGSHLGVLEFDKNNDLKYQSFLTLIYKKNVDNFVKYQIQFNDPLLGYFVANFV